MASSSKPSSPVPVSNDSGTQIPNPVPDPAPVTSPVPVPSHSFTPSHLTYKNRLQEFAVKSKMPHPIYQTTDVGGIHVPMFRSTVRMGERSYTTQSLFFQRKAAEQEVAKIALESLLELSRDEGRNLVSEVSPFCKSILNEYAAKLHVDNPTYNTVHQQRGGVVPVFTTTLVFNGKSYTGYAARTKKDAENSAAHAAILSIMGDSSSGTTLVEMIKSKSNFFDAIKGSISQVQASAVLATANTGNTSVTLNQKDTGVAGSVANTTNALLATANAGHTSVTLDQKDPGVAGSVANTTNSLLATTDAGHTSVTLDQRDTRVVGSVVNTTNAVLATTNAGNTSITLDQRDTGVAGSVVDNSNTETKVEFPESSDMCQEFQIPNQEPSPEAIKVSLELGSTHSIDGGSSSKKRRKNKKKANKKSRLESPLPADTVPTNQVPTCSVSQ